MARPVGLAISLGVIFAGCDRDAPAGGWDGIETVIANVFVISIETATVDSGRAVAVRDGRIDWIGSASGLSR